MGQYIYLANSMTTITDKNIKGYVDAYLNLYKDNKGNTLRLDVNDLSRNYRLI
jgi:hypothetical protein